MKGWLGAVGARRTLWALGCTVLLLLLTPTVGGLLVARRFDTSYPWAALVGALVGIVLATTGVTRIILGRYEEIAPSSPEEEQT